ncbi:MAG TPA: sugar phosphate isomerase/epimerase family protein [Gemmatimonadales bacterium]|nr:sugar phosphate isomerase/epimerase family protein [Gemmatimonadales bacterium]
MTTRRQFLETTGAILAAGWTRRGVEESGRLPLGFSTLGCPQWDWSRILDFAAAHDFAAVELRGLQASMDLTECPEFAPARIAETKRQLAAHGLVVSCLGSSANMHEMDEGVRAKQLAEARRFIDLAQALDARYVRVFGNKLIPGVPRATMLAHIAAGLRELGTYAGTRGVTVLIESHGDFTDSPTLLEILRQAGSSSVALLWDAHHTFVSGKEQPEDTVRLVGPYIRHTHLKDSVPGGNDRRYVLTGTGEVPVERQVAALVKMGYPGYYSFEWEKRWHPEIEDPEVAFAQFATVARGYLARAGVSAAPAR